LHGKNLLFIFAPDKPNNDTIMKHIYTYIRMAFIAITAMVALSSCDEDHALAYDLEGIWQGTIVGNYYSHHYGPAMTEIYDTEMYFERTHGTSGTGWERTYSRRGRSEVRFDWGVRNGRIYMEYYDGYRILIDRYETYYMGNNLRFRGFFVDYDTNEEIASFSLIRVESPHDENYYNYRYTRSGEPTDSVKGE